MREQPIPGMTVTVVHLATEVDGVVDSVDASARSLVVTVADGERLTFRLSPATGRWQSAAGQSGPRLRLHPD